MVKRFVLVIALFMGIFLVGCKPPSGVARTGEERQRSLRNAIVFQQRMMVDEWDDFWLTDRVSYMSYWPVRETD